MNSGTIVEEVGNEFPPVPADRGGHQAGLGSRRQPEARREYIETLRAELREFEQRYQVRTEFLREALRSGALEENLDVTNWALAANALAAAEKGDSDRSASLDAPS